VNKSISFRNKPYSRPNQKWACGKACSGKECLLGPDKKGSCQSTALCQPYKDGDRWRCTRPTHLGGSCEEGPSGLGDCCYSGGSCQPVLSPRQKRGKLILYSCIAISLLLLVFTFTGLNQIFFSPGPLSSKHQLDTMACDSCHSPESDSPMHWIQLAFSPAPDDKRNAYCLNCHKFGEFANKAHSNNIGKTDKAMDKTVACSSCHQEHKFNNLITSANQQGKCNICHKEKIESFNNGHPEIGALGGGQRTALIFDHNNHYTKHFDDDDHSENKPEACITCHVQTGNGVEYRQAAFKNTCKKCHLADVTGGGFLEPGIKYLSVPALDIETLEENNLKIGLWPGDVEDEELLPLAIWLLSKDSELTPLLVDIQNGDVELADLTEVDEATLKLVQKLVWQYKFVLHGLAENPENQLGELRSDSVKPIISLNAVATAVETWFPNIKFEKIQYERGRLAKTRTHEVDVKEKDKSEINPGEWYLKPYSLQYRPVGHEDKLLFSWYAVLASKIEKPFIKELFNYISHKEQPGQCSRCHSIDELSSQIVVNWTETNRLNTSKFTHESHALETKDSACQSCHKVNEDSNYLESYKAKDRNVHDSNFKAFTSQLCSQCHDGNKVTDSCASCHNYHLAVSKLNMSSLVSDFR